MGAGIVNITVVNTTLTTTAIYEKASNEDGNLRVCGASVHDQLMCWDSALYILAAGNINSCLLNNYCTRQMTNTLP